MKRYFCQGHPTIVELETAVLDARPGAVLLEQSPFYPGGGGQMADRGTIVWSGGELAITGFEGDAGGRGVWHLFAGTEELYGPVRSVVDPAFRRLMSELHTSGHVANAIIFQMFDGALVTGVQMSENGTIRVDFDLPGVDNDRLRALQDPINDAIQEDFAVCEVYVPVSQIEGEPGLVRSKFAVPPSQDDGTLRVIDIVGLDRQACGGTHLASTRESRAMRVLKVENKGRQNRRIRFGLEGMN